VNIWIILAAIILGSGFAIGSFIGAPFLPIRNIDAEAALDLAGLKPGDTIIDLGSGDGRTLIAAAKKGIKGVGYEINILLWMLSIIKTWKYRKVVKIHLGDYWSSKLPEADAIYVFLITHHMARLDRKLRRELRKPTKVISYVFELPAKPVKQTRNTFIYLYGQS
jgi:hypothetical protein